VVCRTVAFDSQDVFARSRGKVWNHPWLFLAILAKYGVLCLVIAVLVALASIVFVFIAIGFVATLLGNLAVWPLLGAMLIGQPITPAAALGIAALMAVVIYVGCETWPDRTNRFFEMFGAILSIGMMCSVIALVVGAPVFLVLKYLFNPDLPAWTIMPIGLAIMGAWVAWALQSKSGSKT
jgi:hypothetical protein